MRRALELDPRNVPRLDRWATEQEIGVHAGRSSRSVHSAVLAVLLDPAARTKYLADGRDRPMPQNETNRFETYIQAFSGTGPKYQVSTDSGTAPR